MWNLLLPSTESTSMNDDQLAEAIRTCHSLDGLHALWKQHSDQIIASMYLRNLYQVCSMSCDGP